MKKRFLLKKLKQLGWWKAREGLKHEIWTNGKIKEPVPRHVEISEFLGKKIIKISKIKEKIDTIAKKYGKEPTTICSIGLEETKKEKKSLNYS